MSKTAVLLSSGLAALVSTAVRAQGEAPSAGASQMAAQPGQSLRREPTPSSEAAPGKPAAQAGARRLRAAPSEPSEVGEVIVTARRVEERLKDVPISITVFTQKQLSNRNIVTPDDLALYTPSLSTNAVTGRDNTSYSIRGFTQQPDTSPSVAVYFADVVAPRSGGAGIPQGDGAGPGSFYDLQNVQVLKGPQGTLFGRNTTGGAVLLVPQKPTGTLGGYIEGLYGEYNWRGLQGALNVPLSDTLRARIAFDNQSRDGLTKNVGVGPDLDNRNYNAVRASLVWDVTPSIENYSIFSYVHSRDHNTGYAVIACDPASFVGANICGPGATQQVSGPHTVSNDTPNQNNETDQYRGINTTTWQASDYLTVKNIISYTLLQGDASTDVFSTDIRVPASINVPVQDATGAVLGIQPTATGALAGTRLQFVDTATAPGTRNTDQSSFTEELQFQGRPGGDKFVWQAGGYYEGSVPNRFVGTTSTQLTNCTNIALEQCYSPIGQIYRQGYIQFYSNLYHLPPALIAGGIPNDFPIGGTGLRLGKISYSDLAVYGQATYAITNQLKLTGGIRYTSDIVRNSAEEFTYTFPHTNIPVVSCIEPDATVANSCLLKVKEKSAKPTGLVDLDYKPTDDILIYAKYARGYRQGSVSPDAATGFRVFGPESIDAYETGLKTELHGLLRGYFNVSYFYNNLFHQQLGAIFNPYPASSISQADGILDATKSKTYGVEAEANINPFAGVNINASYAYLQTKLISAPPVVLPANSPFMSANYSADIGGSLTFSPHDRLTVTPSYTLPLDPALGQVVVGATYSYTSSQLSVAHTETPYGTIKPYDTVNLNLNWNHVLGSAVDLSVFATNVGNRNYVVQVAGTYISTGVEFASYGEQRVVGGKLRYSF